jgi:hypothetical protein
MTITIIKDLRGHFGPARDQDPRPTCMAFAGSDAHAAARPGWQPLSVEWAYFHALRRAGERPHAGIRLETMLATLRGDGQPIEAVWPYIPELFTDLDAWTPPEDAKPIFRRENVILPATIGSILAELDRDSPVLFTMSVSRAFFSPSVPDGIVSSSEPLEPRRVHALVAVGHGLRDFDRFVLVRNSWGEGWGLAGHAWIDVAYLRPRLLATAKMTEEI